MHAPTLPFYRVGVDAAMREHSFTVAQAQREVEVEQTGCQPAS
jgi:hypothetical protein